MLVNEASESTSVLIDTEAGGIILVGAKNILIFRIFLMLGVHTPSSAQGLLNLSSMIIPRLVYLPCM